MNNLSRHVHFKFNSNSLAICGFAPKDGFFVVEQSINIPLDRDLARLLKSDDCVSYIVERIENSDISLSKYDTVNISFPSQYGLLKSVKIDKQVDPTFEIEQVKWEFKQISKSPISDFSLLLSANYSRMNERLLIALRKQLVEISRSISNKFNLTLSRVSLSLLVYLNYLARMKSIEQNSSIILVNIESNFVEIGFYFSGVIQSLHTFEIKENSSADFIQIELRNKLDSYMSNNDDLNFEKICLTGYEISSDDANQLSDFLHLSTELTIQIDQINIEASEEKMASNATNKEFLKWIGSINYNFVDAGSNLLSTTITKTPSPAKLDTPNENPFYKNRGSAKIDSIEDIDDDYEEEKKSKKAFLLWGFALLFLVLGYFLIPYVFSSSEMDKNAVEKIVKKDSIKVKAVPKNILEEAGKRFSFLKQFSSALKIKVKDAGISQINLVSNDLFIELIGKNRSTVARFAKELRSQFTNPLYIQFSRKRNSPNSSFIILYKVALSSKGNANFKEIHALPVIERKIHSIANTLKIKFQEFTNETNGKMKSFFIKSRASKKSILEFIDTLNSNLNNVSLMKFSVISTNLKTLSDKKLLLSLRLVILE